MRKEILFAIVAGILFGVVVAFGVWRANSALTPNSENGETITEPEEEAGEVGELRLAIASPSELDVITIDTVEITGVTDPNAWIAISGDVEKYIAIADDQGEFTQTVELIGGVNQLTVWSFNQKGEKESQKITLVYSTEFEKELEDELESSGDEEVKEATEESGAIREKVQEKIEERRKRAKAYIGTITDISEDTIQIKSGQGEIQQIAASDEQTSFVKIGTKNQSLDYDEIAIGDYIIAMGFINSNDVLNARRFLVTDPPKTATPEAYMVRVSEINDGKITTNEISTNDEINLEVDKNTLITVSEEGGFSEIELEDIETKSTIIFIGSVEDEVLEAKRIHITSARSS
ncbi:MAG: hypothetical protein ACC618_00970 [Patescibacteria group bacterium]